MVNGKLKILFSVYKDMISKRFRPFISPIELSLECALEEKHILKEWNCLFVIISLFVIMSEME